MTDTDDAQPTAAGQSAYEIHRSLGWRPVSAAPVMRPDNAVVGRIGPYARDRAGIDAVNARLPKDHQGALVEARFANRFDGLMLLDVYIDTAKLPKAPGKHTKGLDALAAQQKDDLIRREAINGIIEACGGVAKTRFQHTHYFHGRRSGNDIKPGRSHLFWLWSIRVALVILMVTAFIQWDKVRDWGPNDGWVLPFLGMDLGPFGKQTIAPIWSTVGWLIVAILIGEITWWTKLERLWNNRNFNFNGISFFVRTDCAAKMENSDASEIASPLVEIPTNQPRIDWITDAWLANQKTLKIDSEYQKDRLAIIQLRRCYLKLIENVSHQMNDSHQLDKPPILQFLLPRALWRGFTILIVSFLVLLIGGMLGQKWVSGPFTLFLVAVALFCLVVFAHSVLFSSTSVHFRVEHLRNVRGFLSYANAFGSVVQQVMHYGSLQDPAHRPRDPSDLSNLQGDPFKIDSFESSADIVQVMIEGEEHTMRVMHFRAAVAAAVLALLAPTLIDRLTAEPVPTATAENPTWQSRPVRAPAQTNEPMPTDAALETPMPTPAVPPTLP